MLRSKHISVNSLGRLLLIVIACLTISGCEKKYTTVADDITVSEPEVNESEYIELATFEAKEEPDDELVDIGYCAILVPSGFVPSEEVEGMYVSDRYPMDSSNIYYTIVEPDEIGIVDGNMTEESFLMAMQDAAYYDLSEKRDIVVDSFEKESIDDVPCIKIRSHYSIGKKDVQQLIYIVIANKTHVVTYTQISDDDLLADFIQDEGNIKLVREISQA